jgi:hypothetical protein
MFNDAYGNLGNEMRTMKDGRAGLMAGIKDNRNRIRAQTGQALAAAERFVAETGKANEKLAAQTRQMLSHAERDLKARTRQTLAEADELVGAIRKDVAALKADAGRIITDANGFLAQTSSDNAKLKVQTRRMLAHARAESKAQTRQTLAEAGKVMAQTKVAVAGLRTETGRVLADAAGVMRRLSEASRQRAAGWRSILHVLHGNGSRRSASAAVRTAPPAQPARKTAARRTGTHGKRPRRHVA